MRWRAPEPAPGWQGVRAADSSAPSVRNRFPCTPTAATLPQSEDCLSLNVWTPDAHAKLPVMVWIYGGAFVTGGSANPIYDGVDLAKHGVVVVTLQLPPRLARLLQSSGACGGAPTKRTAITA